MKGRKKGRREVKTNGAPLLLVKETIIRHRITEMPRRVARRARDLGITYDEIARRMGISRPVVSRETNKATMTVEFFRRLCEALEVEETDRIWFRDLPPIMTSEDGAQKFIAEARKRSKKWAKKSPLK
jgi:transcriptional regulator with XRE-family HTH domain